MSSNVESSRSRGKFGELVAARYFEFVRVTVTLLPNKTALCRAHIARLTVEAHVRAVTRARGLLFSKSNCTSRGRTTA